MKISTLIALFALVVTNKAVATTFECTLEFQNGINSPVIIMYQSYHPKLQSKLGKLQKLTIPEFESHVVSFANTPYVKWDVISPKHIVKISQNKTATSCNSGGKVKVESRT
jgi:hypothetical protein